jgi:hypothetical protein
VPMICTHAHWSSALVVGLVGFFCGAFPSRASAAGLEPGDSLWVPLGREGPPGGALGTLAPGDSLLATRNRGTHSGGNEALNPGDPLTVCGRSTATVTPTPSVAAGMFSPGDTLPDLRRHTATIPSTASVAAGTFMPGDALFPTQRRNPPSLATSSTNAGTFIPGDRLIAPR